MQKFIVVAAITLVVYFLFFSPGKVEYESGVLVETTPVQEEYSSASEFELNGYDIKPLKSFQIKARVLGRENYSSGRESDLSPVDLALGSRYSKPVWACDRPISTSRRCLRNH